MKALSHASSYWHYFAIDHRDRLPRQAVNMIHVDAIAFVRLDKPESRKLIHEIGQGTSGGIDSAIFHMKDDLMVNNLKIGDIADGQNNCCSAA